MDPLLLKWTKPLQHVSTLVRQLFFDMIFVVENIVLLFIALNANIIELKQNQITFAIVLLGFTFVGLILKCVYYRCGVKTSIIEMMLAKVATIDLLRE